MSYHPMTPEQGRILRQLIEKKIPVNYFDSTLYPLLRYLANCGYAELTYDLGDSGEYTITEKGKAALFAVDEKLRHEAESKANEARQYKIAVAQVLVSAISFALGLIVEHFSGIVGVVLEFFG